MERSNETLQDLVHHFAPLGPPPEAPSQDRIPLLLPPQVCLTHAWTAGDARRESGLVCVTCG